MPPPPRLGMPSAGADPADIDWDDDDEVTTLFNKESHPPPPGMSFDRRPSSPPPPPPMPRVEARSAASQRISLPTPAPSRIPVPVAAPRSNWRWVAIGGAILLVSVLVAIFALPSRGELVVNVSGPGGVAVDGVSVKVDGVEKCNYSPCPVQQLSRGTHTVTVSAPGYAKPAPKAIPVAGRTPQSVEFHLAKGSGSEVAGTGVKVGKLQPGMKLFVDDKERGSLPLTVTDLEPGEHEIKIAGNNRFREWTETVEVSAGSIEELEPKLELLKGVLEVKEGTNASGADITLKCGRDRRVITPPTRVEIDVDKRCEVLATRSGYTGFVEKVKFSDEEPEQVVTVALRPVSVGGGSHPPPSPPAAVSTKGYISISAVPAAAALVDGRPVGRTPKRVAVSPGNHTVIFVHPQKGRRALSVSVKPGKTVVAAVRF